jgi:hypothetical protein
MSIPLASSLAIAAALMLAACAETRISDHTTESPRPAALDRTLLVVETALPADTPDLESRTAEAQAVVHALLDHRVGGMAAMAPDAALSTEARARGLGSVSVVRIEDYARRGNLYVALALPPVSWDTRTDISVRLRVIDAQSGTASEMRRDRTRGGLFSLRSPADLAPELAATLESLFTPQGT